MEQGSGERVLFVKGSRGRLEEFSLAVYIFFLRNSLGQSLNPSLNCPTSECVESFISSTKAELGFLRQSKWWGYGLHHELRGKVHIGAHKRSWCLLRKL